MNVVLQKILARHFDPASGAPYWLERERVLGFSVQDEIRELSDLSRLGPFDMQALRDRPIEDFLPADLRRGQQRLILGETGGATGEPKATLFAAEEFQAAFVQPFLLDTAACDFTTGHWLWLGPSGPHVLGKAAREIALQTTGNDGFSIDFDPRWYRSLTHGSVARERYLRHVTDQALRIIRSQKIAQLFTTPVVLATLADAMTAAQRERIRLVYLGGMSVDPILLTRLAGALPDALFFSGYGNSLFGVCHEAAPRRPDGAHPVYHPPAGRLHHRIVPLDESASHAERLQRDCRAGERGQIVVSRLDASLFLPNVMERDSAILIEPGRHGEIALQAPEPLQTASFAVDGGIY